MPEKRFCVYLMASRYRGATYLGVTSNLAARAHQHRNGVGSDYAARWGIDRLVWFEPHDDALSAIAREKALKKWRRVWKWALIEAENPEWQDLFEETVG